MNAAAGLPLLSSPSRPIAWRGDRLIPAAVFLADVRLAAERLPSRRFSINLCEDRYCFLVAFAAALVRGQTNLFPPSRVANDIQSVAAAYPDSGVIDDDQLQRWLTAERRAADPPNPSIPAGHIAAIVFTSGSTGRAQPHPKRWDSLVQGARLAEQRFGFGRPPGATIIATAPPQHMYGFETTVMTPLVSGVAIHDSRPFFPADIRAALAAVPPPRILLTTPPHLRVCVKTALDWPPAAMIISATAPLSAALAEQAERRFAAPVLEIYGCTEAGSIASRRTLDGDRWRLYEGLSLVDGYVHGPHLPQPVPLNDIIEPDGGDGFRLLGRREDLVNIAGKRSSLPYLNSKLNEIEGVEDGVFLAPDEADEGVARLAALVVAPGLSRRQIMTALAQRLDPVFLPRPLLKAPALPRNATGKLPRAALLALFNELQHAAAESDEAAY